MDTKSNISSLYNELIERFVKWAKTRPDIKAAIVVGSRARANQIADEWADLDILIVTSNPEYYLTETEWITNIGDYWLTFLEPTATGNETERRILFEGGLDVDLAIFPLETLQNFAHKGIPPQFKTQAADTFGRGARILLDRDSFLAQFLKLIPPTEKVSSHPPTKSEFLQVINDFLYHTVWTAKHLRRGELWWAKMCSDCYMQRLLLQMIEWHARAMHGWDYDTWFRGRFLEKWADPRIIDGLHSAFAHYDTDDVSRALIEEFKLFHWIAQETAAKLNYQYPREADGHVMEWVENFLLWKNLDKNTH
jgi:aminoglycoside 6-adenylyltransferase